MWGLAVIFAAVFYFIFDPLTARFMPQCLFYKLTGWQCSGCGSQRLIHSLLHGDFPAAFHANPLLFCCLPLVAFMVYVELMRKRRPTLYERVNRQWVIITAAVVLLLWMPVRNLFGI